MDNNVATMVNIVDDGYDEVYNIMLNEKEIKFLNWLAEKSLLSCDVSYHVTKGCCEDFS